MDVMELISKCILIVFGIFLMFSGFLMFFNPEKVRTIISKAGSTFAINYGELSVRLFIGLSFILVAKNTNYDHYFTIIGCFLIGSAIVLMCVPMKLHNKFSVNASNQLKPLYLRICAPFSIVFGVTLLMVIFNK